MIVSKGNPGYIKFKKLFQSVIIILFIAAGLSLFFICRSYYKTEKNIGTVIAVLFVLPAAKALINLCLFLPYKSTDKDFIEKVTPLLNEKDASYYDCVFTSYEYIMHLDFLLVRGTEIVAYSKNNKKNDKILKYFTETLNKQGVNVHMHIFEKDSDLLKRMQNLSSEEIPVEITAFIRTILV